VSKLQKNELVQVYNKKLEAMKKESNIPNRTPGAVQVIPPPEINGSQSLNVSQSKLNQTIPPVQQNRPPTSIDPNMPPSSNSESLFQIGSPWTDVQRPSYHIIQHSAPSAPPLHEYSSSFLDITPRPFRTYLRPILLNQRMVDEFLSYGYENLQKGIEFCAVICGQLKNGIFECTHLLIPRQQGTPDSCSALNEVELFEYQFKKDLITLGWIHTHPTQTAFLSTIDLRTQFGYQSSLPEGIAIVCAPQQQPNLGIFRVTEDGMYKIKQIMQRNPNFGLKHEPINEVLFEKCLHVTMSYDVILPYQVVDLR
jgi:proteasome lid subunit RPN8/RPN11